MFGNNKGATPKELVDAIDRSFDFLNPHVARMAGEEVLVLDLRPQYRLVCMRDSRSWAAQYVTVGADGTPLPAQIPPHSLYVSAKKPVDDVLEAVLQAVVDWYRVRVEPTSPIDNEERRWVMNALRVLTP